MECKVTIDLINKYTGVEVKTHTLMRSSSMKISA
jgi:hypothetical protein